MEKKLKSEEFENIASKSEQVRPLNLQQQKFVAEYLNCMNAVKAALRAGYSPGNTTAGRDLMALPQVREAILKAQNEVMEKGGNTLETAVKEADEMILQARELKQMTAASSIFQTKMKLLGMLIERHDIRIEERVDIASAMRDALARTNLIDKREIGIEELKYIAERNGLSLVEPNIKDVTPIDGILDEEDPFS